MLLVGLRISVDRLIQTPLIRNTYSFLHIGEIKHAITWNVLSNFASSRSWIGILLVLVLVLDRWIRNHSRCYTLFEDY
jgi:hypothetical protein